MTLLPWELNTLQLCKTFKKSWVISQHDRPVEENQPANTENSTRHKNTEESGKDGNRHSFKESPTQKNHHHQTADLNIFISRKTMAAASRVHSATSTDPKCHHKNQSVLLWESQYETSDLQSRWLRQKSKARHLISVGRFRKREEREYSVVSEVVTPFSPAHISYHSSGLLRCGRLLNANQIPEITKLYYSGRPANL